MTAVEKWRQELFNVFPKSDSEPSFQSNLLDKHTLWYCTCDTAKSEEKLLPWCPGFGSQKRKFFLLSSQIYEAYSYHGSNFSFFKQKTRKNCVSGSGFKNYTPVCNRRGSLSPSLSLLSSDTVQPSPPAAVCPPLHPYFTMWRLFEGPFRRLL